MTAGLIGLLTACGGGGSSSGGTGALSLNVTDAPVSDADISAVWVRITSVIVKPDGNGSQPIEIQITDNLGNPSYTDIDLKSLSNGKTATVFVQEELPAGHYSWIRLVIDPAHTYVVETGGGKSLLECSSCDESHLKLNRSFTIDKDGVRAFTVDFDLRKSITLTDSLSVPPRPDYAYKLRPTLRIIDSELAGNFSGAVDQSLIPANVVTATLQDGDKTGCSVYVFDGSNVTPDNMDFSDTGIVGGHTNPVASADVTKVAAGGGAYSYLYTAAFLPAGDYTAALTCDSDDPFVDESNDPNSPQVTFLGQKNVTVEAGMTTENVDFPTP